MPGITRTAMQDDDGSGTTGTILNNAWKQELYGQIDGVAAAPWIAEPYVASDYLTSGGGTWVPGAIGTLNAGYCVIGRTLFWDLTLNDWTITGSPTTLSRTPFGGFPIARQHGGVIWINAGSGSYQLGLVAMTAGSNINFFRDVAGTPWVPMAESHYLRGQGFYAIA
jgi:hypothetical protein